MAAKVASSTKVNTCPLFDGKDWHNFQREFKSVMFINWPSLHPIMISCRDNLPEGKGLECCTQRNHIISLEKDDILKSAMQKRNADADIRQLCATVFHIIVIAIKKQKKEWRRRQDSSSSDSDSNISSDSDINPQKPKSRHQKANFAKQNIPPILSRYDQSSDEEYQFAFHASHDSIPQQNVACRA
jgi:hypothetical protein